jgi:hypothetical protein
MGANQEAEMLRGVRSQPALEAVDISKREGTMSWGAILAGATAAAALSLILLMLGTGLGLSSISPWAQAGITATTFGLSTIVWLALTQVAASGMGGYLAGRLRNRWLQALPDETYFRDTAHGFLAWAVATLATAALLGSAIAAILGTGVQAGAALTGAAATSAAAAGTAAAGTISPEYFADALFRKNPGATTATAPSEIQPPTAEVIRIVANNGRNAGLPPEDLRHVSQLVAAHTGLNPDEAQKRVIDAYGQMHSKLVQAENTAREAADKARKAAAHGALWLFVSLLLGAFVASLAATFGGRQRDH